MILSILIKKYIIYVWWVSELLRYNFKNIIIVTFNFEKL